MRYKAFNFSKNPKYDQYQRGLASMVYKFFHKKFASFADKSNSVGAVKKEMWQTKNYLKNYTNQLLKNLKGEKCNCLL